VARPIVARPIVARPIVARPIVARPIVARPIVARPIWVPVDQRSLLAVKQAFLRPCAMRSDMGADNRWPVGQATRRRRRFALALR
jgi:hypothetical protein